MFLNTFFSEANRLYVEVDFTINRCQQQAAGQKTSKCKETFNLYYYEANSDIASSTFPPWREKPYVKIDTVAANAYGEINARTFAFTPQMHR